MLCRVPSITKLQELSGENAITTFTRTSNPQLLYTWTKPHSATAFTHAGAVVLLPGLPMANALRKGVLLVVRWDCFLRGSTCVLSCVYYDLRYLFQRK